MHAIKPIGIIHSPYTSIADMPIQPKGAKRVRGQVVLNQQYTAGLQDLSGFSHVYLIYSFHQASRTEMTVIPFMDQHERGVFSTRSPLRPNHIGLSVVELVEVKGNVVLVDGVDVLDGTPLLDLKPYIEKFDAVENSRSGWLTARADEIENARSDQRFK